MKTSHKAIFTICIGKNYQQIAELTHPAIRKYADGLGVDFIVITDSVCSTPHWQKLIEIQNLLKKYERVLYIDTDTIIREDCPDLFDIVPDKSLGLFNEAPFTFRSSELMIDTCKEYGVKLPDWDGRYFNTGVMIIPRRYRHLFEKPEKENCSFYEQTYLNMIFAKEKPEIFELPYQYNRMTCMDAITGEERFASYIIHYAGYPSLDFVLGLIPKDIEKWEADKGNYRYKHHIFVSVSGGLGDQICAEPAIRFMQKHLYPYDEIIVASHWPRVFSHLNGNIKVVKQGEFADAIDTPYYLMQSHPDVKSLQWAVVSNLLCHTVDFCAISMLKRTLPLHDKNIKLAVSLDDFAKLIDLTGVTRLDDLVLVHAGRHWRTKTFPAEWWQGIVDGITENGMKVCLIGKNDETTRGTADVVCPEGGIDLRDLLGLGELFALISSAKILVSNDSAPVHIAGAFDNHIILIPSCKHPDHILPYRNGSPYYKACALYKKLTLDDVSSHPNNAYQVSGDFDVKDWNEYLPEIDSVVETIKLLKDRK